MIDTTSVSSSPPARAVALSIIRRYLKPLPEPDHEYARAQMSAPDLKRELGVFYQLWKQYPSLSFWTHYTLDFPLNSLLWFRTADGRAKIAADYTVFHFSYQDT